MSSDSPVTANGGDWCDAACSWSGSLLVGTSSCAKSCAEIEMVMIPPGTPCVELGPRVALVSVSSSTAALTDLGAGLSRC